MNNNGGKSLKKQKNPSEIPSKTVDWTALKRAAEEGSLRELSEATTTTESLPVSEELSTRSDNESTGVIDEAPLKPLNWSALKSVTEDFSTSENAEESPREIVEETQDQLLPDAAPEVDSTKPLSELTAQNIETEPAENPDQDKEDMQAAILRISTELNSLHSDMTTLLRSHAELVERGMAQDKVFNVLHTELQDYKTDFVYERFKPTVRMLLFLCDALEQFDCEMELEEHQVTNEQRTGVSPTIVRENIDYFRTQLVEALATCAVTPMETPEGNFDPHLHKAVKLVTVPATVDNTIQEVLRTGWYLNDQVLRPADVVVGKVKRIETKIETRKAALAEN